MGPLGTAATPSPTVLGTYLMSKVIIELYIYIYIRFAYGQDVGFVADKAALGQVFSEYFGFPCQTFHRFPHYHNRPGLTQ
jgi:hypothetical protein